MGVNNTSTSRTLQDPSEQETCISKNLPEYLPSAHINANKVFHGLDKRKGELTQKESARKYLTVGKSDGYSGE
jgi:hypothetical protein